MNTKLFLQNIKCGGCANTVTKNLLSLKDVAAVEVNIEEGSVYFNYTDKETVNNVQKTLKDLGYPESGTDNKIIDKAKSYVSCAIGKINS